MAHEVESMAYRMRTSDDVPWHGLGTAIQHDVSVEEMMKMAGVDWTVSKRKVFVPNTQDEVESIKGYLDGGGLAVPADDFFALVRDSDNQVLGPCGKDYTVTQNYQAFDFFKKFTNAGEMAMDTAGSLQGGRQVWVLAKLKQSFTLPGGDRVDGYLLFSSPHIWGKSLMIKFVAIRVVCMNTFTMAIKGNAQGKAFRMPHIRAFDAEVANEARISMGIAGDLFNSFEATANKLASTRVSEEIVVRYIADIFQPELLEAHFGKSYKKASVVDQAKLLVSPSSPRITATEFKKSAYDAFSCLKIQPGAELPSSAGTLWGAFNAVTYYSDFVAGRDRDNALYSNWFGPRAAQKQQAFERAYQMAEVLS